MMAEVSENPSGKARVDDAAERITRALVEVSGDVDGGQVPGGGVDGGQVPGGMTGRAQIHLSKNCKVQTS